MIKKIVIAADSFKGSVTSAQVATSIEEGVKYLFPQCEVVKIVVADGGEGIVDAIVTALSGQMRSVIVKDPLMRDLEALYGLVNNGTTAVIEMSAASGLPLLSKSELNPEKTTTFGTGELILDALNLGCREFLVGIGGSATNDAGIGMLSALGFRFLDKEGAELECSGAALSQIVTIDNSNVPSAVFESTFTIACDVTNPFFGQAGASYIYAPQKGADPAMVKRLDLGLQNFADAVKRYNGIDISEVAGAGAAGGLGGGFMGLLGAELVPGIDVVLDASRFTEHLNDCDLVITGEGRIDSQTLNGKAPYGIMSRAAAYNVPTVAIGGSVGDSELLCSGGFLAVLPVQAGAIPLEKAMERETAMANIKRTTIQMLQLFTYQQ